MTRKIQAMYKHYGRNGNSRCADCTNFLRYEHRGRNYRKCAVYGDTHSEATDWNASFGACGMFDKPFDEKRMRPLIEALKCGKRGGAEEIDENQVRLF